MQYIEPIHVPAAAVCPSFEEIDTIEGSQSCPPWKGDQQHASDVSINPVGEK